MYYIQIAAGALQTLEEIGITSGSVSYKANGIDSFDFAADSALTAAGIAFGTEIKIYDVGTCIFIGEVTDIPSDASLSSPAQKRYTAKSLLNQLERMQFTQDINAYNVADAEIQTFVDPRVVLGYYGATRITNAQQIYRILEFAIIAKGFYVSLNGDAFSGGFYCPLDQKENISCWDAIVSQLRWLPDHILYCDYSSGTTIVNLVKASTVTATNVAVTGNLSGITATPRHDLQMVGLNIFFRKVTTMDGSAVESRSVQTAGDNMDPFSTNLYVDLDGGNTEFVRQAITVADYPVFAAPASAGLEAWLEAKVPWLADIDTYTVTAVTRSGAHNYAKELLKGTIAKWMSVDSEEETITATIEYDIKDGATYIERATMNIPVQVTSCNGTTKVYSKISASDSGEVEPVGLAAGLYAAWSMLHWDGSISSYLVKTGYLLPGSRINITGAHTSLSTMAAIVQASTIDLSTGEITIDFGTCRAIEADSYTALYRAIRYRRFSTRILSDSDDADALTKDETSIEAIPKGTVAQSPGIKRKQIGTQSTNSRKTSLSSEDLASNEEAKLRSITIEGGTSKVLASSTFSVLKWDATAPTGYEWETVNIVLDSKIVTREILVKTSTKADVVTWSSSNAREILQVKGGTGDDLGKLRIDKGYLKS